MLSKAVFLFRYIYYLVFSKTKHGIHSPFVFDFINNVLHDSRSFYCYDEIESVRTSLLQNQTCITIQDFGAGSRIFKTNERKIADIARTSLKPAKYAQLFFRIVQYYQPATALELGTSFGISSAYHAKAIQPNKFYTFEGSTAIAQQARQVWQTLQINNIECIEGNFDITFEPFLQSATTIDYAFVDGNHSYQPTINYFHSLLKKKNENSIFIFDDIYWSNDMMRAWNEIKQHSEVTCTIDLFFIGIVFFRKQFKQKEHFMLRY